MVNTNLPANRGKKGVRSTQVRKGQANKVTPLVTSFGGQNSDGNANNRLHDSYENLKLSVSDCTKNQDFDLTLIHGLVKKCYGCDNEYTDMDRKSPFDLVIRHEEVRPCFDRVAKRWYIPQMQRMSNAYYHLNENCVKKIHKHFTMSQLIVSEDVRHALSEEHKKILYIAGFTYK